MTTITGHLTQTEKTHIKAILSANLMAAKVNRKTYFLTKHQSGYSVSITENITNWCETRPRVTTSYHSFTI